MQSPARSVADEPDTMIAAAENRRRILGSTIFGGTGNTQEFVPRRAPPQPEPPRESVVNTRVSQAPRFEQRQTSEPPSYLASTLPAPSRGGGFAFPDLNFDSSMPADDFTLTFKPRPAINRGPAHRLEVPANPQMRRLRDELNRDTEQFMRRLRQIGQV
jgi:hypothetical protein